MVDCTTPSSPNTVLPRSRATTTDTTNPSARLIPLEATDQNALRVMRAASGDDSRAALRRIISISVL